MWWKLCGVSTESWRLGCGTSPSASWQSNWKDLKRLVFFRGGIPGFPTSNSTSQLTRGTVGLVPEIKKLAQVESLHAYGLALWLFDFCLEENLQVTLAISLHAANDEAPGLVPESINKLKRQMSICSIPEPRKGANFFQWTNATLWHQLRTQLTIHTTVQWPTTWTSRTRSCSY